MENVKTVAVIGAGVSGVSAAVHLKRAGLDVSVCERGSKAGGVWVYDDRVALPPDFPSVKPSIGDSPAYEELVTRYTEEQAARRDGEGKYARREDSLMAPDCLIDEAKLSLLHAPPGPCYASLTNNVTTTEMELRASKWKPGTEDFVNHSMLATYIQDTAREGDIEPLIKFGTRVDAVEKTGSKWQVSNSKLVSEDGVTHPVTSAQVYDAVVIASGHYHACNIPDTPGLSDWHQNHPSRITHSKSYRNASGFENQNILLVGSGVSSCDIAREISPVAKTIYQVSRGGAYDLPDTFFPSNTIRIGDIAAYEAPKDGETELAEDGSLPGSVLLKSGHRICGIHRVVLCTGYHMSYPFLSPYHSDTTGPEAADEKVLVTNEGQRTHNLHKDIFYIPDPTLAFIGVPYHVATFSLYEFQAMAVAAVFGNRAHLPTEVEMRREYKERLAERGPGRGFHSLRAQGDEIRYVDALMELVNQNAETMGREKVEGHSKMWLDAYAKRSERIKARMYQALLRSDGPLDELLAANGGSCV